MQTTRRRRLRLVVSLVAVPLLLLTVALTTSTFDPGAAQRATEASQSHLNRFEFRDPDRGRENRGHTPNAEQYADRAFPRSYVTSAQVQHARKAFAALPQRLPRKDFRPGAQVTANPGVGAAWSLLGPTDPIAPGPTTESLKDSI